MRLRDLEANMLAAEQVRYWLYMGLTYAEMIEAVTGKPQFHATMAQAHKAIWKAWLEMEAV